MTSLAEYTAKTTAELACIILDDCAQKVLYTSHVPVLCRRKRDRNLLDIIDEYSGRAAMITSAGDNATFNKTATFFRDTVSPQIKQTYSCDLEADDFDHPCETYNPDTTKVAINRGHVKMNSIIARTFHDTDDAIIDLFKAESEEKGEHTRSVGAIMVAMNTIRECNSVIDEYMIGRLISIGIQVARIPYDIAVIFQNAYIGKKEDKHCVLEKRIYDKLYRIVHEVNMQISTSVPMKRSRSVFLAHARLWHTVRTSYKDTNLNKVRNEYQQFLHEVANA